MPWEIRMGFDLSPWRNANATVNYLNTPLNWNIKSTHGSFLRVQDFMIIQLINDLPRERPIYFAVTVSPENRVGLDDYLQMEGLVFKLKTSKVKNTKLNRSKMIQNITETSDYNKIIYNAEDYTNYINSQER